MFQLIFLIFLINKISGENVNTTISGDFSDVNPKTRFGIFTDYCGPGNWASNDNGGNVSPGFFEDIDHCCKNHDECPNVITRKSDYKKYPELEYRSQDFSKYLILKFEIF